MTKLYSMNAIRKLFLLHVTTSPNIMLIVNSIPQKLTKSSIIINSRTLTETTRASRSLFERVSSKAAIHEQLFEKSKVYTVDEYSRVITGSTPFSIGKLSGLLHEQLVETVSPSSPIIPLFSNAFSLRERPHLAHSPFHHSRTPTHARP